MMLNCIQEICIELIYAPLAIGKRGQKLAVMRLSPAFRVELSRHCKNHVSISAAHDIELAHMALGCGK